LTTKTLTHLDSHPDELQRWMSVQQPALAGLFTAMDACHDAQPHAGPLAMPEVLGRDVPGRKWQQLLHFAAAADAGNGEHTTADVVEWCSGKAHLSRLVLRQRGSKATGATGVQAAHAIEWNAALCADGARLAQRDALPVVFHRADALHISATAAGLGAQSHALALHACGDLHVALLHKAALAGVAALDVAPCCYHLTKAPYWQPLSVALAGCTLAQLPLTRDDLRLAVQEAVTSSPRVIRQQLEMAAWRLGFDALQREIRGVNAYLPTPSRPARVLRDGFAAFCADLAAHHRLTLPAGVDHAHFLRQGRSADRPRPSP
jgi:hypothetical protein